MSIKYPVIFQKGNAYDITWNPVSKDFYLQAVMELSDFKLKISPLFMFQDTIEKGLI